MNGSPFRPLGPYGYAIKSLLWIRRRWLSVSGHPLDGMVRIERMIILRAVRTGAAIAGVAAAALLLAACGSKSNGGGNSPSASPASSGATSSSSTPAAAKFNACMILDTGGIDDHSFNESSYAGMTAAKAANPNISISYVPSTSSNDYTPNLNAEVAKSPKCGAIIAVGGLMADNVKAAATANPTRQFAEVDNPSEASNMYGMQFNTAQGGFLGGILAAGMSTTGKVATFGGAKIGPVTIYMDGFWEGVQYYNAKNHKNVQVLGWSEKDQSGGTFVPGDNPFGDLNGGQSISNTFIQQGADVIFPVAGGSGLGAGAAAAASGGKVKVIWVDTDGCESAAQYCKYFIGSVTKGLASAVKTYVTAAAGGTFPTGNYVGTLANNGTGLAIDSKSVPASLLSQISAAKAAIIAGTIKITSPSQPSS
jgi:basic membrane protein A